ncbi:hypothetical protein [Actinoplanes sp. NPDC051851]|uniref:hypothetical protein n=1 Tax=Actinoplanes sp. NPDC051851 TaxID=3154753 RepID=UPI00342716C8
MDRLDALLDVAAPLLNRVDSVLGTTGAPEEHRVWAELRRVGLLPGDAARAVAALRPAAIAEAAPELRGQARVCADTADTLPPPAEWVGEAATAYDEARRRTAERLAAGPASLRHRLTATADLADALTGWMTRARTDLAATLTGILTSAEAVTLIAGVAFPSADESRAAAEVAATLLGTIADTYDRADDLLDRATLPAR